MGIRYVIGRAGSGKTHHCLDDIRDQLLQAPEGDPIILLVPEQATFQAEAALVSTPGLKGLIRAQVLSFRRLAFRVMQETGGMARIHIDDSGKAMLLHRILQQHKDQLRLFNGSAEKAGFIDNLNKLFTEFRRYGIDTSKLEHHVGKQIGLEHTSSASADKLHDLRWIYGKFEEQLKQLYVDSEDYLTLLAEQVGDTGFMSRAEVWVDGFHGFTPQEYRVLEQLMVHCKRVTITVSGDRDHEASEEPEELDLFNPTVRTLIRLKRSAEQLGVEQESALVLQADPAVRFKHSPMLAYMEANFGNRTAAPFMQAAGEYVDVSIQCAVNRRAEVEGLAREMIRQVREKDYRWRDMAVLVRNMEQYRDLLSTTLTDYGIPFFFDQKRSLLHHPLAELIRSALEVTTGNWRHDAVFRCVKTDLLLPLELTEQQPYTIEQLRGGMNQLENVVLAFGIQGYRWKEARRWEPAMRTSLEDNGIQPATDEPLAELLHYCRQRVVMPLSALEQQIKNGSTVRQMAQGLYMFLIELQLPEKLERLSDSCIEAGNPEAAKEHAQIWDSIIDLLDQLVEMLGEEKLPASMFAELIETGLDQVKLALIPPALDQVLIGSMDRTRSSRIKRAYILGVNDGVIPAKLSEDGLLSETERERFIEGGLELADGSRRRLLDEQFLIYTALTTPSHHLWISYPLADEEGKSLLPSEIVKRMRRMFPMAAEHTLLSEPPVEASDEAALDFIAHPDRVLSMLSVQLREWTKGRTISRIWWEAYNWYTLQPYWREKLKRALQSLLYTNEDESLTLPVSRALYGERLRASVSRMEKFVACPFSQFASHGLKLAERRIYRLEAPDIGQLFHAALSRVALRLQQEGAAWSALTVEQCFALASAAVDELAPRLQAEILLSSNRHRYITRKLKQIVGRASAVLGEHSKHGSFVPIGLEVGFGAGQILPPLEFHLDNGCTMEIIGRIDRVDQAFGDRGMLLRIIDYKSSSTDLKLTDVFYGMSLQMLTYLDVVITHAEQWLGSKAKPAGVLYFHVHNPMLQRKNVLSVDQAEKELMKRFKMRGLVLEDPDTVQLMDSRLRDQSGYSNLIPVAMKTDGSFYKSSSLATEEQWNGLRGYVRHVIKDIGSQITDGHVEVRPFRMGNELACTFCPYKPVCRFEPNSDIQTYNRLRVIPKEQVWQAVDARRLSDEFR